MDQPRESGYAFLAGTPSERFEQSRPQADPHPAIAHPDRELCSRRIIVAADVARRSEALAGVGIDRDQRLVPDVIYRRQVPSSLLDSRGCGARNRRKIDSALALSKPALSRPRSSGPIGRINALVPSLSTTRLPASPTAARTDGARSVGW
jgi:hypothetical protein